MKREVSEEQRRVRALLADGFRLEEEDKFKDAEIAFQQVLSYSDGELPLDIQIVARSAIGQLYQKEKRYDDGIVQLTIASDLAERIKNSFLQEQAIDGLGKCYLGLENYERALSSLSDALLLAEQLELVDEQISLLGNLGLCNMRLDKPAVAQRYYEQRLTLAQDREDKWTIAQTMGYLGNAHALLGQYRVALDYFRGARTYFAGQKGANNALSYVDTSIVKATKIVGDELAEYVSCSIAERIATSSDEGAKKQSQAPEYPGDLKQDVLCGVSALADGLPEILPLISHIGFHEPPRISTQDILRLVGEITRHTSDSDSQDPGDLFEAARYIAQLRRGLRAAGLLERIRKGEVGPDISGTGHGSFVLYLRSFAAAPMMPRYRIDPWGDVDLEEVLASKLDQGPWPLIALGNPEIQAFGSAKIKTNDATWQNDLVLLGKHADIVIVAPCATEGTSWEIEWVVINKFLKKAVFVMPPSSGKRRQWWEENWAALQRWSRYLGMAFPDYVPDGLFFKLASGDQIASISYETVLASNELWQTLILELAGQGLFSDEWTTVLRDSLPYLEFQREAEDRGLDVETLSQKKVDEHVNRIENRVRQLEPRLMDKVSPYKLGMLEKGLPPQGDFASWPPDRERIPSSSSLYTIWEGPTRLMWVGTTVDTFATLNSHAEGRLKNDNFCAAVLNQLVLPSLSEELTLEVEKGLLPLEKMVRFKIRHGFRYKLIPMAVGEAQLYERLIRRGVLDAGSPVLDSDKQHDSGDQ